MFVTGLTNNRLYSVNLFSIKYIYIKKKKEYIWKKAAFGWPFAKCLNNFMQQTFQKKNFFLKFDTAIAMYQSFQKVSIDPYWEY